MEYLNIPNDYFEISQDDRFELAHKVVYNSEFSLENIIEENSVDFITSILYKRLKLYIQLEEYEQADFLDKIIKVIIKGYEKRL